jgi:hypothetical protein
MKEKTEADEFADNSITEEELVAAARRSFLFLSACVDGEIADAKVADRVMAARGLWSTQRRCLACSMRSWKGWSN